MSDNGSSFKSMTDLWNHRIQSTPDSEALTFRKGGAWTSITWKQADERVQALGNALIEYGLEAGERVAILSATRVEWLFSDFAIMNAGAATVTIYPSNTPEECQYIIDNSGTRVVIAENDSQVEKLVQVRDQIPTVDKVIVIDGRASSDGWVTPLSDLEASGRKFAEANPDAYTERGAANGPDTLATLIYTSGTTGKPKGVMLTHDNWLYEGEAVDTIGIITPTDRQFLFLPLSHSFAKAMVPIFIRIGVPTVVDGQIATLVANLAETNPTWMAAVPRIFEKAYNKIVEGAKEGGGLKYAIFKWAVSVGTEVSRLRQQQREPSGLLALKFRLADKLVFSKVKEKFGGRIRFFISGGAPLAKEIGEFFHACDILILEGYGLTESSAATFVNRPDDFVFGTVGPPVPGTTLEIAEDGEILIKGRGVMKGYYDLPEATPRPSTQTVTSIPATSASASRPVSSRSRTVRRSSSSRPAARTSPPPTSRTP